MLFTIRILEKQVFLICNLCHESLSKNEPHLPKMCPKMYDANLQPSLLFEHDISMTPFTRPTPAKRIVMILLMHTKYLTIGYHVSRRSILLKDNFLDILQLFLKCYRLQIKMHLKNTFRCPIHSLRISFGLFQLLHRMRVKIEKKLKVLLGCKIRLFCQICGKKILLKF